MIISAKAEPTFSILKEMTRIFILCLKCILSDWRLSAHLNLKRHAWNFLKCEKNLKIIYPFFSVFLVHISSLVFQDPKDHVFLMGIGLSKQVRMSLPRIVFPPIMCLRNAWNTEIGSLNSDMRTGSGLFWWGGWVDLDLLQLYPIYLSFFFLFSSHREWWCCHGDVQSR